MTIRFIDEAQSEFLDAISDYSRRNKAPPKHDLQRTAPCGHGPGGGARDKRLPARLSGEPASATAFPAHRTHGPRQPRQSPRDCGIGIVRHRNARSTFGNGGVTLPL